MVRDTFLHVAKTPIQPGLEHVHSSSGQPVLVPHYAHCKEFPPFIDLAALLLLC